MLNPINKLNTPITSITVCISELGLIIMLDVNAKEALK